jgi:hypothetical protein
VLRSSSPAQRSVGGLSSKTTISETYSTRSDFDKAFDHFRVP